MALNLNTVSEILADINEDNFKEKIDTFLNQCPLYYKLLVLRLTRFQKYLSFDAPMLSEDKIIKHNLELYHLLQEVLECKDSAKYKLSMDLVHIYFYQYRKDAYGYKVLKRNNIKQWYSRKHNHSYRVFCKILSFMSDRTHTLDDIDVERYLDRNFVYISSEAIENLINYYRNR